MKTSILFKRLSVLSKKDAAARALAVLVERVFADCCNLMRTVVRTMPEYTLHDEVHLRRVVELMGRLIPPKTLENLSPLEIAALILAAALHDVGMAPSTREVESILKASHLGEQTELQLAYQAFREAYPHLLVRQRQLHAENKHSEAQAVEAFFLAEFLRKRHAERGREYVFDYGRGSFCYDDFDFTARLADTCYSHSHEPSALTALPCWELVRSPGEYCNWRFIAVLLRLADIVDFDPKRTPPILFEHLGIRTPVSILEWKKHQSIKAWDIRPGRIAFAAQCPDPVIEKCIRDFIGWIDRELVAARALLGDLHDAAQPVLRDRYALALPGQVDTRGVGPAVGPEGAVYEYADLTFNLDKDNIVSLVMGIALYADPILFLRELLQNSVDSVRHRVALNARESGERSFQPQIAVRLIAQGDYEIIQVEDNGMGMDTDIVRNYFARVGRSYYRSGRFLEERTKAKISFQPVSQFGIGILSVFMAGDKLSVDTLRLGPRSRPLTIEVEGEGSLFWFRPSPRAMAGTAVSVRLKVRSATILRKEENPKSKREPKPSLYQTVAELAPHIEFPILVEEDGTQKEFSGDWSLPSFRPPTEECVSAIDLDLTADAPSGLNGVAKIFLIQECGQFKETALIEEPSTNEENDLDLCDYVQLESGYIEHVHRDRSVKEGISQGYSTEVDSNGRWSQQGFNVPYPLFKEHPRFENRQHGPTVEFPFPVWYDLDLFGEFMVPLTADRKSIIHTKGSEVVCARIYQVFADLLFRKLGRTKVEVNKKFFVSIAKSGDHGEIFEQALKSFLES